MEKNSISDLLVVNEESLVVFGNYVFNDLEKINFLSFSETLFEDMYKEIVRELDFLKKTNPKTIESYKIYRGFETQSKKERKILKIYKTHKEGEVEIFNLVDGFICFNLKKEMEYYLFDVIGERIKSITSKYMDISALEAQSDYTKVFFKIINSNLCSEINNTITHMFKDVDMDILALLDISELNCEDLLEIDKHKLQLIAQRDLIVLLFALKHGYLDQVKIDGQGILDKI